MGRPSIFSQELADTICERLATGESLRKMCADDDMPDRVTVSRWLASSPEFCIQYACAREMQADALADEIIEISDKSALDMTVDPDTGREIVDHEHIQRSRLRVDARKWYAAKVAPRKYGDKITQEITGKDGGPIQSEDVTANDVRERLASRIAGLAPAAQPDTE